ncbi:MAG TPA: DUF4136 domain-containing protein [Polyangiaceae bacterium]|nr:DUF4136 domain-containing protein [Polyangiaceae bacterium]
MFIRTLLSALALLLVMPVSGCASGPQIRVDMDARANMKAYKTFAFFNTLSTDDPAYASLLSTRLKNATRAQLERNGYTYSETEPELLVNFYLKVVNKQELRSTGGYYGYRHGYYGTWTGYPYVETINYKEGTLSVDLVDAKRKQLVWQGVAEGEVSEEAQQNPGPAIDRVVTEIFSNFPNPPK